MSKNGIFYTCCAEAEQIDLVRASGYDGIVFRGAWLSTLTGKEAAALRGKLDAAGLVSRSLNAFCPPSIALVGPAFDLKKLAEYTKVLAERAAILGIKGIGIGSPLSRRISGGYDRQRANGEWAEALAVMADICAPMEMQVLAEAVCTRECNFMNTTAELLKMIEGLHKNNLGLVFDLYHEVVMAESADVLEQALPYVRVAHIAQDRDGQKYYPEESIGPAVEPYISKLREGFSGEFSVEASVGELETALPGSLRVMRGLLP